MTTAFTQNVALVSESDRVNLQELAIVSAAIQRQVMRDVFPVWGVDATVEPFVRLDDVPLGYWPMIVKDSLPINAAGVHLSNDDGQPFALITANDDRDVWALTASHECLEMLVDPFGNRLVPGDSPKPGQGSVLFLLEICDPSEAEQFTYPVSGALMSDFYTPRFFDPVPSTGMRYSFVDAISKPREVLQGGYLSWMDPETKDWWQETWFSGQQSTFVHLGPLSAANGDFRSRIHEKMKVYGQQAVGSGREVASRAGLTGARVSGSSNAKATSLYKQIDEIVRMATSS